MNTELINKKIKIERYWTEQFYKCARGEITEEDFSAVTNRVIKKAKGLALPVTWVSRRDNRSDYQAAHDLIIKNNKTKEASIITRLCDALKSHGHTATFKHHIGNEKHTGLYLQANIDPDFIITINDEDPRFIDVKRMDHNSIFTFKKDNLMAYDDFDAVMFVMMNEFNAYFSSEAVKLLNTFPGSKKHMYNGKEWAYKDKIIVEVSDREEAEMTLDQLKEQRLVEVWLHKDKHPDFTLALEKYNNSLRVLQ
jgi:hypothetical protein